MFWQGFVYCINTKHLVMKTYEKLRVKMWTVVGGMQQIIAVYFRI